jgi:hypothetical protein
MYFVHRPLILYKRQIFLSIPILKKYFKASNKTDWEFWASYYLKIFIISSIINADIP